MNVVKGLSEAKKAEVLAFAEGIFREGFEAGKASRKDITEDFARKVTMPKPNKQRAELIKRAGEFVEEMTTNNHPDRKVWLIDDGYYEKSHIAEFILNTEKRTVVVLIKNLAGTVRLKGIAKCMPGDVFNADIGKAIALARALEIEIPRVFLQAVQPDEVIAGMIYHLGNSEMLYRSNGEEMKFGFHKHVVIADDTNAEYEVSP